MWRILGEHWQRSRAGKKAIVSKDSAGGRGLLFINGSAANNDCVVADTHQAGLAFLVELAQLFAEPLVPVSFTGGSAVFLHGFLVAAMNCTAASLLQPISSVDHGVLSADQQGKLSEINATLPHLTYQWISDAGQEAGYCTTSCRICCIELSKLAKISGALHMSPL